MTSMDKIENFSNSWGAFTVASRGASLLSLQIGGENCSTILAISGASGPLAL